MLSQSRSSLRTWALCALVLFAFDAIGPALAAFAGTKARSQFVEICTLEGMKRVAVADQSGEPAGSNAECFKCPLCAPNGGHGAIDAPRSSVIFDAVLPAGIPAIAASAPPASRHLPAPPSRAPPPRTPD
jgi:hypothetical protein